MGVGDPIAKIITADTMLLLVSVGAEMKTFKTAPTSEFF